MILPYKYRSLGMIFFVLALAVGYSRVYLTAHFVEDVYAGSIVGVFGTLVAYAAMERYYLSRATS
jgi:membrane-associated phospholipid phosphatase